MIIVKYYFRLVCGGAIPECLACGSDSAGKTTCLICANGKEKSNDEKACVSK